MNTPIIICGNKCDLEQREISSEEALGWCNENHFDYIETSALTDQNVEKVFIDIVDKILQRNNIVVEDEKPKVDQIDINKKKENSSCC